MLKTLSLINQRATRYVAISLASVAATASRAQEPELTVLELAPETSLIVVGCDDLTAFSSSFEGSGVASLLRSKEFRNWVEPIGTDFLENMKETGTDLDLEALGRPTGRAGMAVYLPPPLEEGAESDPIGFMAMVEWKDGHEEAQRVLDVVIEDMEEADDYTILETIYEDRVIFTLTPPPVDREAVLAGIREWWEGELTEEDIQAFEDEGWFEQEQTTMRMTLDDGLFILSNHLETIETTLDRLDGVESPSAADNEVFQRELEFVRGGSTESDIFAVGGVNENILDAIEAVAERFGAANPFEFMSTEEFSQIATFTGLGNLEAAAMTLRRASAGGVMAEQVYSVSMPDGPAGMFTLIGEPDEFAPPHWMNPRAAAIHQFQFNFDGVVPLIRETLKANDSEEMQQASAMFEGGIAPTLELIFAELGPHVFLAFASVDPETAEPAAGFLAAVETRDALTVQNVITQFQQMAGLTTRDFLGNRVFDASFGGFSIGFGKGYMLFGETPEVEAALRADEKTLGLPTEPAFDRARRILIPEAAYFGYQPAARTVDQLLLAFKTAYDADFQRRQMEQYYRENDIEIEEGEFDWIESPEWYDADAIPDSEFFLQFIGDSAGTFRLTGERLIMRAVYLTPAEDE